MKSSRQCVVSACLLVIVAMTPLNSVSGDEHRPTAEQLEFFERSVRPLLVTHCYSCHSAGGKKVQAGLLVDRRDALITGGDSGEALVPGDPDASLLIEAVRYESYEMPPKGKLPESDIAILERWVSMGAPWPVEDAPESDDPREMFDLQQRKSDHWVWQPIQSPIKPPVKDSSWPRNAIDHFVLSKLEEQSLRPSSDADRRALIRRLSFDLVGMPPTTEQVDAFLSDDSSQAVDRLVDQLLDSPHFGERWGRHWLDLVRYAESRGHEFDNDALNAYQYRDYIIRAFNADVPHDQLVREHLAGDLLDDPRLNPDDGFNESVLGTGFWFLGEWVHSPVDIRKDEADRFDNMIDVMSKTFLGVTVACARCHDHKFDAISSADYYSLSGFLQSSDYRQVRFETIEHNRKIATQLADLDGKYRSLIDNKIAESGVTFPEAKSINESAADSVVVNFADTASDSLLQDGVSFGEAPRELGQPYVVGTGDQASIAFSDGEWAVNDPLWNGLESVSEKGVHNRGKLEKIHRSGRTLRTPTFELTDGNVACLVQGEGHVVACVDSHRLIAGPLHGQTIKEIKSTDNWVRMDLSRYVGHRIHLEFTPATDKQLAISLVMQGASKQTLDDLLRRQESAAETVDTFAQEASEALGDEAQEIAMRWAGERASLEGQVKRRSRLAMAMMDGTGEDDHVLIRGNSSKPGEIEPRHFLSAIAGNQPMEIESGSGRLSLADQINDPSNPLTSRVAVNRIWHYLMGRGIVPTTDDFGVLGQLPTHPELLDHLATRFIDEGRSTKQMIRYIVSSRVYQLSSRPNADAMAADPKNMLWHHRPPKRLEGEIIRDSLLALSGRLDATLFGEPVPIHLTGFMDGRGRPGKSGPLDGAGRRSIYTAVRRNFLSPFMLTFDTPAPFSTMGRRNVSNVPAQALILMNDPFVVEQAKGWGARAIERGESIEDRIRWMYETAFAREATDKEVSIATAFVTTQSKDHKDGLNALELWADFAHALINTKEFIFLR